MSNTVDIVGVLGGMGPLATIDFQRKVLAATHAECDQDHVPLIICSIPQIPDRTAAFQGSGKSPLDAMVASGLRLKAAGATMVVVPCNTAHLWYDELRSALQMPMLHMLDIALREAFDLAGRDVPFGILATDGTLSSGLYTDHSASKAAGLDWVRPTPIEMREHVTPGIEAVKAGRLAQGRQHFTTVASALRQRGAKAVVMGCTEIPAVLDAESAGVPVIDPTAALARAAVQWWLSQRNQGLDPATAHER